jgi:hypothetical protein
VKLGSLSRGDIPPPPLSTWSPAPLRATCRAACALNPKTLTLFHAAAENEANVRYALDRLGSTEVGAVAPSSSSAASPTAGEGEGGRRGGGPGAGRGLRLVHFAADAWAGTPWGGQQQGQQRGQQQGQEGQQGQQGQQQHTGGAAPARAPTLAKLACAGPGLVGADPATGDAWLSPGEAAMVARFDPGGWEKEGKGGAEGEGGDDVMGFFIAKFVKG